MRVAMIGTGYVGLVSGACFADFGHEVTCVDKDQAKIAALERGEVPIYEPGLNDLVAANTRAGRLKFTTDLPSAVGGDVARAREVMAEIYRPLYLNRSPILFTDRRTAELIKYAANAFLATKITFINEIADLAEKVGADVQEIARGIGLDNRIGSKFLHAGPGYGGSCFPKDTLALIKTGQDYDAPLRIVEAVAAVNDSRKRAMARKVAHALGGDIRGQTIAVLGLTFKPNTDDMRDSPSLPLITALQDMGAKVRAFDPVGMEQAKPMMSNVTFCDDAYACAEGASALVIVTEWEQFRALDFKRLKTVMVRPVLVDLRNIYRAEEVARHGFTYDSIGRPRGGVLARRASDKTKP